METHEQQAPPAADMLDKEQGSWGRFPVLYRAGTGLFLAFLAFFFIARKSDFRFSLAGGLEGFPSDTRRVGWGVQPDPSLQRAAETIRRWRQQGQLAGNDRGLVFQPAIADYCAWFCPEEKFVFDPRFPHDLASGSERWQQRFREESIAYLVLDDPSTFNRLVQDPQHWILLHVEGRAAIFGWREGDVHPSAVPPLEVNRLAFAAEETDDDSLALSAPTRGPDRAPQPLSLWTRFLKPTPMPTLESETAATYLRYFRAGVLPQHRQRWSQCWAAYAAGLTGLPLCSAAGSSIPSLLLRLDQPPLFLGDIDEDLPAVPLLVIRLTRRALALNPEDATAYLHLGQAYLALHELTGERLPNNPLSLLGELRSIQIATALQHALILNPDLETAHHLLANLYSEQGYFDAVLYHRREELRLVQRLKARGRQEESELDRRLRQLEQQVADLEKTVQNGQRTWTIASRNRAITDPVADAEEALRLGLARTALDEILLSAPEVLLKGRGWQLELLLALQLARAEQIRSQLLAPVNQENKRNLGYLSVLAPQFPGYAPIYRLLAYDWLVLLMAAASGDYELANDQLQEIVAQVQAQHDQSHQIVQSNLPLALAAEVGLGAVPQPPLARLLRRNEQETGLQFLLLRDFLERERADLNVLGGMLAMEQGHLQRTKNYLTAALHQHLPGTPTTVVFASRAFAETYLRRIQKAAQRPYAKRPAAERFLRK